jgi:hypothetical protein
MRLCSSLPQDPTPIRRPGAINSDNPKLAYVKMETKGPPRFLENPCIRALLLDPDGTSAPGLLRRFHIAFRFSHNVGSRDYASYGALSHSPQTRCLRFAVRITPTPRKTRYRVGGQPFPDGTFTRWVPTKGFSSCILLPQAYPGASQTNPNHIILLL